MAIIVSVLYNGRFLPDIILLTQGYSLPLGNPLHLNVMKGVLFLQPMKQLYTRSGKSVRT